MIIAAIARPAAIMDDETVNTTPSLKGHINLLES
jgi:hypothetical protein